MRRFVMGLVRCSAPSLPPISVKDIELSRPLPDSPAGEEPEGCQSVRALVRLHGIPLGVLQLPMASYGQPAVLAAEIEAAFKADIDLHLDEDGIARTALALRSGIADTAANDHRCQRERDSDTLVSVVVPTVGRASLQECVQSILSSTHRNLEVIVVDNAPWNATAHELVQHLQRDDERVRYEVEPISGSSRARNLGLRSARGPIVAFTDDDVVVDERWLQHLLIGFHRAERVVAVTGLTVPQRLETAAEVAFELHGGFGRGFRQRLWDLDVHTGTSVLYPYSGLSGASTNNLAIVRDTALASGGFDERFGPGTPTYASEDTDLILSMVVSGHQISYEPSALVRHAHRSDWEGLKWQVFTYSTGRAALLLKWAIADRKAATHMLRQIPRLIVKSVRRARRYAVSKDVVPSNQFRSSEQPRCLVLLDCLGLVYGPIAYFRAAGVKGRTNAPRPRSSR